MLLPLLTAAALASEAPPPPEPPPVETVATSASAFSGPVGLLSSRPPQLSGLYARSHELAVSGAIVGILAYAGVTGLWISANAINGSGLGAAFATIPVAILGPPMVLAAGVLTLPPAIRMRKEGVDMTPGFGVASILASAVGGAMLVTGWTGDDRYLGPGAAVLASAPLLVLAQCIQTNRRGHRAAAAQPSVQIGVLPMKGGAMASLGVRF